MDVPALWKATLRGTVQRLMSGGWIANFVVGVVLLLVTPLLNGIMQHPRIAILSAASGLTIIIWVVALAMIRSLPVAPEVGTTQTVTPPNITPAAQDESARQTPESKAQADWFAVPQRLDEELFLFRDSPLFTEARKRQIRTDLISFRAYLSKLGFALPAGRLPIGIGNRSIGLGPGQVGVGTDRISLASANIDDRTEVTQSYAEYMVQRLIVPPTAFQAYSGTAEFVARSTMSRDLATYFNWSFWGEKTGIARNWLAAFWDIRDRFGAEFTDFLLSYTVKSFSQGSAPPVFARHVFKPGESIRLPNEFVDYVIYCHLEQAEKVVDNDDAKLPEIQNILKGYGLSMPSSARRSAP